MADPREHALIFTAHSVRGIIAGTKTQTRRLVAKHNSLVDGQSCSWWDELDFTDAFVDPGPSPAGNEGPYLKVARPSWETRHRVYPRIWKGDLVRVKEPVRWAPEHDNFYYVADNHGCGPAFYAWAHSKSRLRAISTRYLPRLASRIWLEVISVRPEKLQDISDADALAEGVDPYECPSGPATPDARAAFHEAWEAIHGKGAWASNPWVFAYDFKRVEQKERAA